MQSTFLRSIVSFFAFLSFATLAFAQGQSTKFYGRDAWQLESPKLRVTVLQSGGHVAEVWLKEIPGSNPLWRQGKPTIDPTEFVPDKHASFYGGGPGAKLMSGLAGHNLCFPYWGKPSDSEYKAGMTVHGEAGVVKWQKESGKTDSACQELTLSANLAESDTRIERTLSICAGESIVYFQEKAQNLAALDRPVGWCEHVTLGPPFLEKGVTFFDASLTSGQSDRFDRMSQWPEGQVEARIDLRRLQDLAASRFLFHFLVDPSRTYAYFTAINPEMGLLFGYLFRSSDFPWMNLWEVNYPAKGNEPLLLTRGWEFSNTPMDGSIKEWVKQPSLWGVPTFEWLNAKSERVKRFCAFSARVPRDFSGVEDVRVDEHQLSFIVRGEGRVIRLPFRKEKME